MRGILTRAAPRWQTLPRGADLLGSRRWSERVKAMPQTGQLPPAAATIMGLTAPQDTFMDEQPQQPSQPGRARRPSGRDAKIAARTARSQAFVPFITRKIPYYEVLTATGLELLEHNADTILEEIGIDFRDDPESLTLWKDAGADVQGERVRFPRGMCRTVVTRSAPREFTQYARNPARNVVIGGNRTVFAPAYGSPFVRSLDEGRRYARIEDFRNF